MKALRTLLDKQKPLFAENGKYGKFHYLFEALETFMFVPEHTTPAKGVQVRDAIDLKRYMMTVVIAILPTLFFGMWNIGHQHYLATGEEASFMEKFLLGAKLALPVVLVAYTAGGIVEVIFAVTRKHPINEGFLVTGILIPLILPVTIPLWQVALGTVFAVLIAKEIFGGTGMNILNIAMTARAFLYFAYPTELSGNVWTYLPEGSKTVDGYSGATALSVLNEASTAAVDVKTGAIAALNDSWSEGLFSFWNMFWGAIPGCIGETSTLMCLIGAAILIITGTGNWKIIFSVFAGAWVMGLILNLFAASGMGNAFMGIPGHYHLVMGGLAFGAVYMATDPVSASQTETGKWFYGALIGIFTVLIRVFNPAYPEGIMLAVLLMNVFAPLIDYFVVNANKNRRLKRATV
jgi:Na+-transporting NADH:ubiquinone oxidoreductase subunit B